MISASAPSLDATLLLPRESRSDEVVSLLTGVVFTLGLFLGMAHYKPGEASEPKPEIEDLRALVLPLDPPPPPPESVVNETAAPAADLTGLEVSREESPVKIAVSPLEFNLPALPQAVPKEIRMSQLQTEFKPTMDLSGDLQRVYREIEVDQRPKAIERPLQPVPRPVRRNVEQLRVSLLILIERDGRASNVRVVNPSGKAEFDEIMARSVKEDWLFSPALKRGKPVRCLVQQAVLVKWEQGSVLEAH